MCPPKKPKAPPAPPPPPAAPERSATKVENPLAVTTKKKAKSKSKGTSSLQIPLAQSGSSGLNIPMG